MLAVIATPECDTSATAWLAAIRAAHDPLQDRVGPHVTLMFPSEVADVAGLRQRLERLAADTAAFDIAFDRLERLEDLQQPKYRFLNVLMADTDSAAKLETLHRAITGSVAEYRPHLTISRFGAVYSAKALERQLGSLGAPLRGRIVSLELLRLQHGAIRQEARLALTGT